MVLARPPKMCNFIEWRDKKIVYKRYASLFFVACVERDDNELIVLEQIHLFVEVLDSHAGLYAVHQSNNTERQLSFCQAMIMTFKMRNIEAFHGALV
eukprot:6884-Heterococcus_DN1.PRE.1